MSALGLGDYGSSDEDEEVVPTAAGAAVPKAVDGQVKDPDRGNDKGKGPALDVQIVSHAHNTAPLGPAMGPAPGPAAMPSDLPDVLPEDDGQVPASPYTANRTLLRNLTMPPIPNFDIPPSPPGSPPAATTAKFDRFLELKKKGVHFNERLHQSSALRNPGLLGKLMDFAGISQEDQYASALPDPLAVPSNFPDWAYADKLVKEHERIAKKNEEERTKMQREAIDFVPAKRAEGDSRSASATQSATGSAAQAVGLSDRPAPKRSRFDERDRRDGNRNGEQNRRGGHEGRERRDGRRSRSPR